MVERNKDFLDRMVKLEQEVISLKSPQPSGTSNTRAYEIVTNKVWDMEGVTEESFPGSTLGLFGGYIQFIADSQASPFASMAVIAEVDGVTYEPFTRNEFIDPVQVTVKNFVFGFDIANRAGIEIWEVQARGDIGVSIKFKFRVWATDKGRIAYGTGLVD